MKILFALMVSMLFNSFIGGKPPMKSDEKLFEYLSSKPEYNMTLARMKAFRASGTAKVGIATHRAANEFAPENSLSAIKIALNIEVDYIEMDVRQTRDGKSVLLHDGNLNRTTTGKGALKELNFDEVRTLSAGVWFDPFFVDEQVPTLEEACRLLAAHNESHKHQTFFYVDCKEINAKILIDCLNQFKLLEGSVFYVNEIQQINQIRSLAPNAKILPGLRSAEDLDRMIETYHPYALDTEWKDLTRDLISKAHAKGVKIFSDGFGENQTVDSYVQAINAGIDVISTNKVSVVCIAAAKISK